MRKAREQLLDKYPYWNETRNNIVRTLYGDEPLRRYTEGDHQRYLDCYNSGEMTLANVLFSDAWIWSLCGDFDDYRLLNGGVKIGKRVLSGSVDVHYFGKCYNICYNDIYGDKHLSILRIGTTCRGWRNYEQMCPSRIEKNNAELSDDIIQKIFGGKEWDDYGEAVQIFRAKCREVYEADKTNHYLDEFAERKKGST